jgi:hypothetical protein
MRHPLDLALLRTRLLAGSALLAACASESGSGIPSGLVVAPMAPPRSSAGPTDGGAPPADARAVAGRPLPPEPRAKPTERCQREVTCRHEEETPPSWAYAPPFELCRPSEGKAVAIFSAQETTEQRRWDPRACCYVELRDCQNVRRPIDMPVPGRPLRGPHREPTVAPSAAGDRWLRGAAAPRAVEPELAARLAARWARAAADEHASVAAFSRASLELLALGAPPDLLERTHRAALDEIAHAEAAWSLASAYAGEARGPGPLPLPAPRRMTPAALAAETLADGVVGETLAAAEARLARAGCADEAVAAVLDRVADDEERHAALALGVLRWLVVEWPDEARPVLRAWLDGAHEVSLEPDAGEPAHGWPSSHDRAALFADVLREVIEPCVRAALG